MAPPRSRRRTRHLLFAKPRDAIRRRLGLDLHDPIDGPALLDLPALLNLPALLDLPDLLDLHDPPDPSDRLDLACLPARAVVLTR